MRCLAALEPGTRRELAVGGSVPREASPSEPPTAPFAFWAIHPHPVASQPSRQPTAACTSACTLAQKKAKFPFPINGLQLPPSPFQVVAAHVVTVDLRSFTTNFTTSRSLARSRKSLAQARLAEMLGLRQKTHTVRPKCTGGLPWYAGLHGTRLGGTGHVGAYSCLVVIGFWHWLNQLRKKIRERRSSLHFSASLRAVLLSTVGRRSRPRFPARFPTVGCAGSQTHRRHNYNDRSRDRVLACSLFGFRRRCADSRTRETERRVRGDPKGLYSKGMHNAI
jgi:hypothetical protein